MKPLARTLTTLAGALLTVLTGMNAIADGISGSGIVKYFHSVVIDGVHYQTENAAIRINGRPALEADLKVGYHVSYRADGDTLEAWSMDYYDTVAGTVESVQIIDRDLQVARIRIMSQTVMTDADTWLHGVTLEDMTPGIAIAVSAERLPNGKLLASAVDQAQRLENVLSGQIETISGMMLTVGGVPVDASNIGLVVNEAALTRGEWIHVLGHFDGEMLHADRLIRMADRGIETMPATVEGALYLKNGQWRLRDMTLDVDAPTSRRLLPGLRVTASGLLNPNGVLKTRKVRLDEKRRERLDGMIQAVQGEGEAITVAGRRVLLDERTSLRDDRDGYRWLGPENLGIHDSVSLIVEEVDGVLRARKVTRSASLTEVIRARIRTAHWWRGPELLNRHHAGAYKARKATYNGKRVPAWRLRFLMRAGDDMTLRFDERGFVESVKVVSRAGG